MKSTVWKLCVVSILTILTATCSSDNDLTGADDPTEQTGDDDEGGATISFSIGSSTRATTRDDDEESTQIQTSEEAQVDGLLAIVFYDADDGVETSGESDGEDDDKDTFFTYYTIVGDGGSYDAFTTSSTETMELTIPGDDVYQLCFVANPSTAMLAAIDELDESSTIGDLKDLLETQDPSTKPMTMTSTCFYGIINKQDTNLGTVTLERIMARIDIINITYGVTITKAVFHNRAVKSTLFSDGTDSFQSTYIESDDKTYDFTEDGTLRGLVGNSSDDYLDGLTSDDVSDGTQNASKSVIYSYEQFGDDDDAPSLTLYYTIGLNGTTVYTHDVDFTMQMPTGETDDDGNALYETEELSLQRNHYYKLQVSYNSDQGYLSVAFTIQDWQEGTTLTAGREDIEEGYNDVTETGYLIVNLTPSTATYYLDDDSETTYSSGETVEVTVGTHTIIYNDVTDYFPPPGTETASVRNNKTTTVDTEYEEAGYLTATLSGVASTSTATWSYSQTSSASAMTRSSASTSGSGIASGTTVKVPLGTYTISYLDLGDYYYNPDSETATVTHGQTETLTGGIYQQAGYLKVTNSPSVTWTVDGTSYSSGTSVKMKVGTYTVSFADSDGYFTPADLSASVTYGNDVTVAATYLEDEYYGIAVGDFIFSDGSWAKADDAADATTSSVYPVAIVFYVTDGYDASNVYTTTTGTNKYTITPKAISTSTITAASDRMGSYTTSYLLGKGILPHGKALALKNASASSLHFATSSAAYATTLIPNTSACNTLALAIEDYDGYKVFYNVENSTGDYSSSLYPLPYAANNYSENAPTNSTDWYLPTFGEWCDFLANIGKYDFSEFKNATTTSGSCTVYDTANGYSYTVTYADISAGHEVNSFNIGGENYISETLHNAFDKVSSTYYYDIGYSYTNGTWYIVSTQLSYSLIMHIDFDMSSGVFQFGSRHKYNGGGVCRAALAF